MKNPEIAKTILQQMRGMGRLKCMTGAYNFADHGNGVSFRFKGSKASNYCKVTLDPSDTYSFELGKIWGHKYTVKADYTGIYCDQLVEIFERDTGLYLSL
jgi:hypothetical protein